MKGSDVLMTLREKILVGAAIATVILGIIHHYWYQPTQLKLSELTNQIDQVQILIP